MFYVLPFLSLHRPVVQAPHPALFPQKLTDDYRFLPEWFHVFICTHTHTCINTPDSTA